MSVKIIYRPVSKNDKVGYLKVRVIENRKPTVKSLKIKIKGKNWLDDKQRVSKNEPNADAINDKLDEVLRDLSKHDAPSQALKTTNKTMLTFYDEVISTILNNGTKLKYIGIRNRFESYLNSIGYKDLKFIQLTPQHVNAFHTYIRNDGASTNTANYNLKSFKALVNKAINSGIVNYTNNPFALLKLKFTPTTNKTLTADEVTRLLDKKKFIDHRKERYNNLNVSIGEFRDIFLFQLFSQGLRCSDVQLLRWSDLKSLNGAIIMEYTQYKTKKKMRLRLTLIALKQLNSRLVKLDKEFNSKLFKLEALRDSYKSVLATTKQMVKERKTEQTKQAIDEAWKKANKQENDADIRAYGNLVADTAQDLAINHALDQIKSIENDIYSLYLNTIDQIEDRKTFIFHFLKNENYKNYKDGANLTPLQYKRLTGTRHYYNRILKQIATQCDININLTSHVARHTYTQLLLDNRADVIAVSQSLGHSHIATTQAYIKQLPNSSLLEINDVLSDKFN
ncbi:tyrosine-type recombinase/integrase [Nonlabens sp. Asnod3-A02]|uniref:tyrosine-type recombinase/integrase n=1 Tax=Nonlabens sp. Asnod3-A02 TaxID=3160579 RepID=UPI0038695596